MLFQHCYTFNVRTFSNKKTQKSSKSQGQIIIAKVWISTGTYFTIKTHAILTLSGKFLTTPVFTPII